MSGADQAQPSLTAEEALARLRAGNERFVRGRARFPTVKKEILAELARGQHPYATILGCSDSRVPPELVFDASFGELFIVRVAGNVISPEVMGTLQYAGNHARLHGNREQRGIARLLEEIFPGLRRVSTKLAPQAQLHAAVDANVRWSMHQLLETPEGKARMREGKVKLVGAIYELKAARVRFLA